LAALKRLASRCGQDLPWEKDWASASSAAARDGRLILVWVFAFGGFTLNDRFCIGPLMDPAIANLAKTRFVLLRYRKGMGAPFESRSSYGLGRSTFGEALLVVDTKGRVLEQQPLIYTAVVHDFLVEAAARHGGPAPRIGGSLLVQAQLAERRGELDRSLGLLGEKGSAEAEMLRARIFRRRRQGPEALAALDRAEASGAADRGELSVERGLLALRTGDAGRAQSFFRNVMEQKPQPRRVNEARFWLGLARLAQGDGDGASKVWNDLALRHPEDHWAWRSAARLLALRSYPDIRVGATWPDAAIVDATRPLRAGPSPGGLRVVRRRALDWLLRHQRADGSWIDPDEILRKQNEFTQAYSAFAALALHASGNRKARESIERAIAWLAACHEREQKQPLAVYYMDYLIWRDACVLWLASEMPAAGPGSKLRELMPDLVKSLAAKQSPGGGWTYMVRTDLSQKGRPPDLSMSFMTAFVLHSLMDAREAGVAVPQSVTTRGLDCLERMLCKNGAFAYSIRGSSEASAQAGVRGAVGRGPLCSYALLRGGRAKVETLRKSFDLMLRHGDLLAAETHKALMHAGVEGLGAHYVLFDWAMSARALSGLRPEERPPYRRKIIELVMTTRLDDGAFADTLVNGRSCGTGLALWALVQLDR
jgi:tetratricopeptide (TPR) repeat protein